MKFFACIALIVALSVVDAAFLNAEGVEGVTHQEMTQADVTEVAAADDVFRMKKSAKPAYGGGGYAAPGPATTYTYPSAAPTVPCGKNLLFSCQPNVVPVPCSAPAPAPAAAYRSYAGAFSEPISVYAEPQFHVGHYGGDFHYGY